MHSNSLMCALARLQGAVVAVESAERQLFGLQYHPEVMHSERGTPMLRHFLLSIAKMPADWKIEKVLEEEMDKIRHLVRHLLNGKTRWHAHARRHAHARASAHAHARA